MKIIKRDFLVSVKLPQDYGSVQISNGVTIEFDNEKDIEQSFINLKQSIQNDTIEEVKQLKNKVNAAKQSNISLKLG